MHESSWLVGVGGIFTDKVATGAEPDECCLEEGHGVVLLKTFLKGHRHAAGSNLPSLSISRVPLGHNSIRFVRVRIA
jgi:hypothetical protein